MQLYSMTGFSRTQTELAVGNKKFQWVWEIRSVNGKGLDIKSRLPQWLDDLDANIKGTISKVFRRGSFVVNLEISHENAAQQLEIDESLLLQLIEKSKELSRSHSEIFEKSSPAEIFKISGVLKMVDEKLSAADEEELKNALCQSIYAAATALRQDRRNEGKKIGKALKAILEQIKLYVAAAEKIAAGVPNAQRQKICKQIEELAEDTKISPERLEQEVLFLIMRADVQEELDRLKAHIKTAEEFFEAKEPMGRRLDFLCQELNREANTLCSKSADIELTRIGMDLKAAIEQFREQIQNVE